MNLFLFLSRAELGCVWGTVGRLRGYASVGQIRIPEFVLEGSLVLLFLEPLGGRQHTGPIVIIPESDGGFSQILLLPLKPLEQFVSFSLRDLPVLIEILSIFLDLNELISTRVMKLLILRLYFSTRMGLILFFWFCAQLLFLRL